MVCAKSGHANVQIGHVRVHPISVEDDTDRKKAKGVKLKHYYPSKQSKFALCPNGGHT